jgi:uncharacterized protein YndB with AHSA1/START domain
MSVIKEMPVATTRITPDQDAVVSEIEIAAPRERVFRALVDCDEVLKWGASETHEIAVWSIDARPGGKWQFVSKDKVAKSPDGSPRVYEHDGEVLEIDPPRLLVHTWLANFHEIPSHKTVVRWELTAIPAGTRLRVTHSGLAQLPSSRAAYSQGWGGLIEAIKKYLEK